MQVTILGSTGQVGKAVINQALKAKNRKIPQIE